MQYKEFRVIIEDENNLRIIKPNACTQKDNVPMNSLRKDTIRIFNRLLAEGNIKHRDELVVLGTHLYNGLFNPNISKEFKQEFEEVQNKPSTVLCLILEFERKARELAGMPWEFIYYPDNDKEKGFFLATRSQLILSRHVPLNIKELEPCQKPLRILIVISKPELDDNGNNLGIVSEDTIIETIEKLSDKLPNAIITDKLLYPTKRSLDNKLKEFKPHVLHFIGHGKYYGNVGYLALVDNEDQKTASWIRDEDLADYFIDCQPRLIFLHACEGAYTESYDSFRGIALQLVYQKVPAVVAMQYEVTNKVANSFVEVFYKSLGEGKRIDEAVQDGRSELGMYLDDQHFSSRAFGSPVVYLQNAEGIIIAETSRSPSFNTDKVPTKVLCPYPYCSALVIPSHTFCIACGGKLMECPKCHRIMAESIGRCGCGYETHQAQTLKAQPRVILKQSNTFCDHELEN